MIHHTKNLSLQWLLLLLLCASTPAQAAFNLLQELEGNTDFLESTPAAVVRQVNPVDVASPLVIIGMNKLLQINLFCRTHPLNTRSLLDLPIFLPQKVGTYCYDTTFGAQLFWNKTNRMHFSPDSSALCTYLSVFGPNSLETIQDSISEIKKFFPAFDIDPIDVLHLFQNMTIEERKLGAMLHLEHDFCRTNLRIMTPVYYIERNFFLTPEEQHAVEEELGTLGKESEMEFAKQHLISDKLGLGDTRITLDTPVVGTPNDPNCLCMRLGVLTTLPTAIAFKKGLKGSFFPKNFCRPTFSFAQLFDQPNVDTTTAVMQNFLLQALNHLAANLIDTELGNNRHVGIGAFMRSITPLHMFIKRPWAECIYLKSFLSLEYLLPAKEKRFFVEISDQAEFDALGLNKSTQDILNALGTDPDYAQAVVDLFDEQFVETLFPFVFDANVHPGFVFRWITRAYFERPHWGFYVGSDFWMQGREKLVNVEKIGARPPNIDVLKATKPLAYQSKIIGSLFYTAKRPCHDWIFGLTIDQTIMKSGIGDDFSISFNIEANF